MSWSNRNFGEGAAAELPLGSTDYERIHDGRHKLFRSTNPACPVVVKVTADPPDPEAIASLRHEYELLRELSLPGIVRVVGLVRAGAGLALVLEDAGRQNLTERLGAGPLSVSEFLEISLQLAETVARLHNARIVHRDISPSNIVWNAESGRATLVDFGIATTLSALTIESASPARLEGTLHYISPEQTGRTGRSADLRTDFYSLGATFYELLTGSPPFAAGDPVELVHAHLARRPRPPHEVNAEVPHGATTGGPGREKDRRKPLLRAAAAPCVPCREACPIRAAGRCMGVGHGGARVLAADGQCPRAHGSPMPTKRKRRP